MTTIQKLGVLAGVSVACVLALRARAEAPPGRYTLQGAGTEVKDNRTGLVWARSEEPGVYAWADAKTQCASKGSGYRMPTVRELQSIVDEVLTPAIDPIFVDTTGATSGYRWSSTPSAVGVTGRAWLVAFQYGDSRVEDVEALRRVRCVR